MTAFGIKKIPTHLNPVKKGVEAKNFGLTEEAFNALKAALKDGDQRLYETIFLKHFQDCQLYLCHKDGATEQEAYDAVIETLLKFRMLLLTDKVRFGNLRYLFTLMARQQYRRTCKRQEIFTALPASASDIPEEDVQFSKEEFKLLSRAFDSLGKNCRDLLKAFYFSGTSLKNIAEESGRSPAAVRKQKSRCLSTLKKYFYHIS